MLPWNKNIAGWHLCNLCGWVKPEYVQLSSVLFKVIIVLEDMTESQSGVSSQQVRVSSRTAAAAAVSH